MMMAIGTVETSVTAHPLTAQNNGIRCENLKFRKTKSFDVEWANKM